jgi:hypothetical protein
MQATGFQHGGGVTMVVDYSGPDTNGRKIRCPSVEAVTPPEIKPSQWTMRMYKANFVLSVMPDLSMLDLVGQAKVRMVDIRTLQQIRALVPVRASCILCMCICSLVHLSLQPLFGNCQKRLPLKCLPERNAFCMGLLVSYRRSFWIVLSDTAHESCTSGRKY